MDFLIGLVSAFATGSTPSVVLILFAALQTTPAANAAAMAGNICRGD
jgi:hypothetical protein